MFIVSFFFHAYLPRKACSFGFKCGLFCWKRNWYRCTGYGWLKNMSAAGVAKKMNFQTDFQLDRARLFSRAPKKILLGHIASASMLIYLASDVLAMHWLVLWGLWEILVTPTLLYRLGKQAENLNDNAVEIARWRQRLFGLFFVVGLSWGLFVFFGLDVGDPAHFSMQMAIVAGASAAASRSLSIFEHSFYLYGIPFVGLLAARIFMLGGDFVLLGVLVLIFIVMMCGLAHDTSKGLSEYLATKLENLDLAVKFEAAALEAQRANASKTQFLAQANHDLRQPIHAIGLLAECLRDQKLDSEGREMLGTIRISVDNLARLFKTLLNITTIDAGGLRPEITRFPLNEVLAQSVRQARPSAEQSGCTLKFIETAAWVETDMALLSSIVQNLVSNAVKYSPGAKILLGARIKGSNVSLHILDQGEGVRSDQQESIFEEFVRGNPTRAEGIEGLGLGLSIVKRTADLLDLNVNFSSTFGVGTHVAIGGLVRIDTSIAPAGTADGRPANQAANGITVLVIDDHKDVRHSVATLLRKWGYQTHVQAPSEPLPENFDLLLMDYQLGIEIDGIAHDGITMAKSISRRRDKYIPTAIVTGSLSDHIQDDAQQAGFHVLQKPVAPLQLRSVLLALEVSRKEQSIPA